MPRYQYASAHAWLLDRIDHLGDGATEAIIGRLSADDIQDLFQNEMDADGYFKDLDAYAVCWSCGEEYEIIDMEILETLEGTVYHCDGCCDAAASCG